MVIDNNVDDIESAAANKEIPIEQTSSGLIRVGTTDSDNDLDDSNEKGLSKTSVAAGTVLAYDKLPW
jgi:hypothetical protein